MFNNPFSSFHDTVAQAKAEREQLDRLLTVSTPRERLLVGAIALLLLGLAAWFLFGNVARSLAVEGVLVEPGGASGEAGPPARTLIWVAPDVVAEVRVGIPATIEVVGADTAMLGGTVARISAVPPTGAPGAFESVAPVSAYRLDITLDGGLDLAPLAGRECRVVLELERQSPVALFGARRP